MLIARYALLLYVCVEWDIKVNICHFAIIYIRTLMIVGEQFSLGPLNFEISVIIQAILIYKHMLSCLACQKTKRYAETDTITLVLILVFN